MKKTFVVSLCGHTQWAIAAKEKNGQMIPITFSTKKEADAYAKEACGEKSDYYCSEVIPLMSC